jgi:hypothetical protein
MRDSERTDTSEDPGRPNPPPKKKNREKEEI